VFVDSHRKHHAVVGAEDEVSRKRLDSLWDQTLYRMGCSD
jgi:Mor family transcriptional regulator